MPLPQPPPLLPFYLRPSKRGTGRNRTSDGRTRTDADADGMHYKLGADSQTGFLRTCCVVLCDDEI